MSVLAQTVTERPEKVRPTKMMQAQRDARRGDRIRALVQRMADKFQNRLDNYEAFLARVQSRREKLASAKKNTDKLDRFLTVAQTNLDNTKTALANYRANTAEIDYTGDLQEVRQLVMAEVKLVREAFTRLHTSMSEAVRSTKESNAESTADSADYQ